MFRLGLRVLGAAVLAVGLSLGGAPGHTGISRTAASDKPIDLVLIVLDGARPNYLQVSGTPHLHALMQSGTQFDSAWAGILESETPSGHATIATGSEPDRDGILSFGWVDDKRSVVNLFSPTKIRQGDMENIIKSSGVPTIASLIHQSSPKAYVAALSGYKYYAADALGGPNADAIMYYGGHNGGYGPVAIPGHVPPQNILDGAGLTIHDGKNAPVGEGDHLAMRLAERTFRIMHPRALLINLPEFDYPLGHVWGGGRDWKDVTTLMRDFDKDLGELEHNLRHAGMLNHTVFVITADHGMTPVFYHIPRSSLTNAAKAAGTGVLWNSYHTAGYLWLRDQSKAAQTAANIVAEHNPHIQSVYYKVTDSSGNTSYVRSPDPHAFHDSTTDVANQYLLNTFNGQNSPDIAAMAAEDSAFVGFGQDNWKGDHGGTAWQSQNVPLVITGPGVRQNYVSHFPARLEDVAPTALTLMGISPDGMQGTPISDAFTAPPSWVTQRESVLSNTIVPLVTSLQAESKDELAAKQ
jgi:predicted AlkP superfamily pyrophosphatase or phosphodiesterase